MSTKTTEQERNWVEEIGKRAFDSIAEMVAALECDYNRLEELRDDRDGYDDPNDHVGNDADNSAEAWALDNPDEAEELAGMVKDAGDCKDQDEARERIEEDALSVEVGCWWTPGSEAEPTEYRILLTTGGPAVRIVGDLGQHNEPHRARLEVQDWFKPWTEYHCDEEILLAYARCFFFGE